MSNGTINDAAWMSFDTSYNSGGSLIAANDATALAVVEAVAGIGAAIGATFLITGITPGSATFTAKYRVSGGGTGTYANRTITVVPL
jgi:hypothetical protein